MKRSDEKLGRALAALADPRRREILRLLRAGDESGKALCAAEIEQQLKLSQPTISHHMGVLCEAGLVSGKKQGHFVRYQRDEKALRELAETLKRDL